MNTLVFDIETVPDTDLGRRLHGLHDLSDEQVAQIMFTKRRQETGSEFLSHEQHRVVAISESDWSSDVCSSDLHRQGDGHGFCARHLDT